MEYYLIFRLYDPIYVLMHAPYSLKPESISTQYMQCTIEASSYNGTQVWHIHAVPSFLRNSNIYKGQISLPLNIMGSSVHGRVSGNYTY
jgi:hypothetical protein